MFHKFHDFGCGCNGVLSRTGWMDLEFVWGCAHAAASLMKPASILVGMDVFFVQK